MFPICAGRSSASARENIPHRAGMLTHAYSTIPCCSLYGVKYFEVGMTLCSLKKCCSLDYVLKLKSQFEPFRNYLDIMMYALP